MDVFLIVRRKRTHIFCEAKETSTVAELKKIIGGVLKVKPDEQRLYNINKDNKLLEDNQILSECGFTSTSCRAQSPGNIGLALREDGKFEQLEITPVSTPPDLPEVMKQAQDSSAGQPAAGEQPNMN